MIEIFAGIGMVASFAVVLLGVGWLLGSVEIGMEDVSDE